MIISCQEYFSIFFYPPVSLTQQLRSTFACTLVQFTRVTYSGPALGRSSLVLI
jgi:hypothetical protein